MWAGIEYEYGFTGKDTFENGVFRRPIMHRKSPSQISGKSNLSAALLIADYIQMFDTAMKRYFNGGDTAVQDILAEYESYINENSEII